MDNIWIILLNFFNELTLSVADSQHLLRVKVLNVINVLCVFYPLAPNAQ